MKKGFSLIKEGFKTWSSETLPDILWALGQIWVEILAVVLIVTFLAMTMHENSLRDQQKNALDGVDQISLYNNNDEVVGYFEIESVESGAWDLVHGTMYILVDESCQSILNFEQSSNGQIVTTACLNGLTKMYVYGKGPDGVTVQIRPRGAYLIKELP